MKKIILLLSLICSLYTQAQEREVYEYLDKNLRPAVKSEDVVFMSMLEFDKSVLINNITTYYLTGEPHSYVQYSNYKFRRKQGICDEWYQSRVKLSEKNYINDKLDGVAKDFHANGNLKREEMYEEGKLVSGKSFDDAGKEVPYFAAYVPPSFPGGIEKFMTYVTNRATTSGLSKYQHGNMMVRFVIDTNGKVTNIKLMRRLEPKLDNSIIAALQKSPLWIPGKKDGVPVETQMMIPLVVAPPKITDPHGSGMPENY